MQYYRPPLMGSSLEAADPEEWDLIAAHWFFDHPRNKLMNKMELN